MFSTATKPTVGILSMGTMGAGIASLLTAHSYRVLTDVTDRSPATVERAEAGGATPRSLAQLVTDADVFLSILPPNDALDTALRVRKELAAMSARKDALVYFELNAISPRLTREIEEVLRPTGCVYIDGGIIGGPPKKENDVSWYKPSIVTSGPQLSTAMDNAVAEELVSTLNMRHVAPAIGSASGLKMCYASMTKGMTALAIQSFATAQRLGVLDELRDHMGAERPRVERSVLGMQPKAYRWIKEMEEIRDTFRDEGGWDANIFGGIADVYRTVDERTELGTSGKDRVEDVAEEIAKALAK